MAIFTVIIDKFREAKVLNKTQRKRKVVKNNEEKKI